MKYIVLLFFLLPVLAYDNVTTFPSTIFSLKYDSDKYIFNTDSFFICDIPDNCFSKMACVNHNITKDIYAIYPMDINIQCEPVNKETNFIYNPGMFVMGLRNNNGGFNISFDINPIVCFSAFDCMCYGTKLMNDYNDLALYTVIPLSNPSCQINY